MNDIIRSQEYILADMSQMETYLSRRDVKYRRNFNRYYLNFNRQEDVHTVYGNILSFYTPQDEATGDIPYYNILRSAVDTTVSKLSQTKVRPFFNPVLGTYKTAKVCRNAQIYFDGIFEMQSVYQKAVQAVSDALIFDVGVLWIDDVTKSVSHVHPWEFIFDVGEMTIGKLTRCELRRKQYPLIDLRDKVDAKKYPEICARMIDTPNAYVDYRIYWDLIGKKEYRYIGTQLIAEREIEYTTPPFVWIYYKDPVKGAFSDSMIDVIYRLQRIVDDLTYRVSAAAQLSPANLVFVPRGSDIKTSLLAASRTGDVLEYVQGPSGGMPFVMAPPPIDSQYVQLIEFFEQKAYNMVGVSQLSAQAKKPTGISSGVALQTLEDVESERHNSLLSNYIRFVRDLAEKMIAVYPEDDEVLPKRQARSSITWKDIKQEREMFNIQYSASNSLSKDPMVKMQQIEKLLAMNVIQPSLAATLLEMPDLEQAYAISTAAYDMNEKIIERVIEDGPSADGNFHFFEGTNIQELFNQSLNTLFRLDTNDEKPEVLDRLAIFIGQLKGMMDEISAELTQPTEVATSNVAPVPEGIMR